MVMKVVMSLSVERVDTALDSPLWPTGVNRLVVVATTDTTETSCYSRRDPLVVYGIDPEQVSDTAVDGKGVIFSYGVSDLSKFLNDLVTGIPTPGSDGVRGYAVEVPNEPPTGPWPKAVVVLTYARALRADELLAQASSSSGVLSSLLSRLKAPTRTP